MTLIVSGDTRVLVSNSGPPGPAGNAMIGSTRDPASADGNNGDYWYNDSSQTLFGPKAAGAWPAGVPLSAAADAASAAASAATAASLVGALKISKPAGFVGGMADGYGRYFMAVRVNGSVVFNSLEATSVTLSSATVGGATTSAKAPAGFSRAWGDQYGRFCAGIRNDGSVAAPTLSDVTSINGTPISNILAGGNPYASQKPVLDAEINLFTLYGQSRGAGTTAAPVLTTAALYDGLRFADGVRPYDATTPARSSLVPLIETDNGGTGTGENAETPASGMEAMIKQRLLTENGVAPADRPYQMLMTCEARSGTAISGLAVGTTPYNAIKSDIDAMRALAQAAGKTSKFRGFSWSQGESDYSVSTSAATYRSSLTAIQSGLDSYAKAANANNGDVICIMDQVFAHATYGHANDPYLALEQLAISEDTPGFVMVGSVAHLPTNDGVHPTDTSAQWMGAYFARAYKRVIIEADPALTLAERCALWQPLKPVEWYRDGDVVMLRFTPESGQLAIDTSTVAAQASYGFTLADSGGTAITISSVALIGKDMVKITAASAIPANATVRAGFGAGGLTNLRDTMGDTVQSVIGAHTYKLHNWCVIFEKTLA